MNVRILASDKHIHLEFPFIVDRFLSTVHSRSRGNIPSGETPKMQMYVPFRDERGEV